MSCNDGNITVFVWVVPTEPENHSPTLGSDSRQDYVPMEIKSGQISGKFHWSLTWLFIFFILQKLVFYHWVLREKKKSVAWQPLPQLCGLGAKQNCFILLVCEMSRCFCLQRKQISERPFHIRLSRVFASKHCIHTCRHNAEDLCTSKKVQTNSTPSAKDVSTSGGMKQHKI